MKHPHRDEWAPYIFGEASPEAARTLDQHLAKCAECRNQLEGWRRTLKRLDAWKVPSAPRSARASTQTGVRWAIAAAIVLGLGFGLGRFSSQRAAAQSRAQLEASLKSLVAAQVREAVGGIEVKLTEARKTEVESLATQFGSLLKTQNEEEAAVTTAVVKKMQERIDGFYIALRKDLETVASAADEQLQDTQMKLIELASASYTRPQRETQ